MVRIEHNYAHFYPYEIVRYIETFIKISVKNNELRKSASLAHLNGIFTSMMNKK